MHIGTVVEANGLMWLKERPFLGSPGGLACGAFTARADRRFTRRSMWHPEPVLPYGIAARMPEIKRAAYGFTD
ncbi:hypothetical protein ACN6KS_22955 [Paenibacillus nitricinens]|uniref:hypothetical protein n=1 Tax=Paenibacillus TaxID=44249 RepID=UPI00117D8E45|nr:hypothetical protein [Paenibacillus sp. VTT E-133280]